MRPKEISICGLSAVRSRFEADPLSIKRLFFTSEIAPEIGDICRQLAEARQAYRCVESEDLERISGSVHHGGIVAVVERPQFESPRLPDVREWSRRGETILILDCIGNPHNLGAIIRTAAFFGITKLVLADHPMAALPTDATYRVASGGMDFLSVYLVRYMDVFLRDIRDCFYIVGAATEGGSTDLNLANRNTRNSPNRSADSENRSPSGQSGRKPIALVLGNEEEGLAKEVADQCDRLVTIPGSGHVESLNVAAAAAILIWECVRAGVTVSVDTSLSE